MLAFVRPDHQLIRRKDIIPTPSQPINSCNRLFAEIKVIIVIKNRRRYLKNLSTSRSFSIYHCENSMILQVITKAIGVKIAVYLSILKDKAILNRVQSIQGFSVRVVSMFSFR